METEREHLAKENPYNIQVNPQIQVDLYLQQFASSDEGQKFISNELTAIDPAIGAEYNNNNKKMDTLVVNFTDISMENSAEQEISETPDGPKRRKLSGLSLSDPDQQKLTLAELKKDSGIALDHDIDISIEQESSVTNITTQELGANAVKQFYFPFGQKNLIEQSNLKQDWMITTQKLFEFNELNTGKTLLERDFVPVTQACGLSKYLNSALFKKASLGSDGVTYASFKSFWQSTLSRYHTDASVAYSVLKQPENDYLTPEDIFVAIQDVTLNHPGLEFLNTMPVFQNRYIDTVLTRLLYSRRQNWKKKLSLNDFEKTGFCKCLKTLDETQDIFSYQHFYVIYCKFWELDRDHDMIIDLQSILRYDGGTMTPVILQRVMEGCGKPLSKGPKSGVMTYEDFVWFILSVEDKRTPQSIEYWFRCLDLNGDGMISMHEISYFYEDQYERMLCSRISDLWKFDDFIYLVKPKNRSHFTLSDLKKSGSAYLFFDMIFDLRKYDSYVRRIDPMFKEMDEMIIDNLDGSKTKLEGFQKFAARSYLILAEEESQNELADENMDDYEYNMDQNVQMDWETDAWDKEQTI